MAETAAVLNSEKTVLLPSNDAGCELADMATADEVQAKKKQCPHTKVVSYVNSKASVKAVSDVCCTSSNAIDVVNAVHGPVLFLPDKNLGSYAAHITDKDVILWDGECYVHENIQPEQITRLARRHPDAKIMVHPECWPEVVSMADFTGSTAQMIAYAGNSSTRTFIIGTEDEILYQLRQRYPEKNFYPVGAICRGMKCITVRHLLEALESMQHQRCASLSK